MEKREDFKRVVEGINQLEQQLLSIVEDGKVNDKYAAEAEDEIHRYFSKCVQALAARKDGLLIDLAQKLTAQSMSSSFFRSLTLLCLLSTKREGSGGCTRGGNKGHQSEEESTESRLICVRD